MPPLGSRGPYAETPAEYDLVQAWSGMDATQRSLSGNPMETPFPLVCYQAGLLGAAAAVAGLIARGDSGMGQADRGIAAGGGAVHSKRRLPAQSATPDREAGTARSDGTF